MPITDMPKPFTTAQESIYILILSQFSLDIEGPLGTVPTALPSAIAATQGHLWVDLQGSSSPLELTSAYPIDSSLNQAFFFFGCTGSCCSLRAYSSAEHGLWSEGEACGLGCPAACGVLVPIQRSKPHPLHWKANSQPLDHQGSPWPFEKFSVNRTQVQDERELMVHVFMF